MAIDTPHFDGFTDVVEIGRGGFGVVYRAVDVALGRDVAIKVLATTLEGSAVDRFHREARAMSALSGHPNVVPIFTSGLTTEGRPFLVMPYLRRGSLRVRVAAGRLPWTEVARIGVRLAGALESAHRAGILHRDIKPDNILVSDFDEPMLADFGIARVAGAFETVSHNVTASVVYAAPEVLDGQPPTVAADVYSLGATLYHLLAGRPAFSAADDEALVALYLRISRDPAPDLGPRVPMAVDAVIRRAMAKSPGDRHPTAEAFGIELQDAAIEEGVTSTAMAISETTDVRATDPWPQTPGAGATAPAAEATSPPTPSISGVTATAIGSTAPRRRGLAFAALGVLLVVAAVIGWLVIRSPSPSAGPATTATSAATATTAGTSAGTVAAAGGNDVDVTGSAAPIVLGVTLSQFPFNLAAGQTGIVRFHVDPPQHVLGEITVAAKPTTSIPVAVLFDNSAAASTILTDLNVAIDPVELDSKGTWVLQIGPVAAAASGTAEIGLAPADATATVQIGSTVDVSLTANRQRAVITFNGVSGQRVATSWTWKTTSSLYMSADVLGPDGASVAQWGGPGSSKPFTLPTTGTYTIIATIDGDGTGAATVGVTAA